MQNTAQIVHTGFTFRYIGIGKGLDVLCYDIRRIGPGALAVLLDERMNLSVDESAVTLDPDRDHGSVTAYP